VEGVRRDRALDLVDQVAELIAGLLGGHWNGDHDPGRVVPANRLRRRPYRRARGEAVVDEDERLPGQVGRPAISAVCSLPTPELLDLGGNCARELLLLDAEPLQEVLVEDEHASGSDRSHRELLVSGKAELAHHEDIERRAERLRQLVRDGHAAARQAEDNDIVPAGVVPQALGKEAPRFRAVTEAPGLDGEARAIHAQPIPSRPLG